MPNALLIIEDPAQKKQAEDYFATETSDLECTISSSTREAVETFQTRPAQIIIADVNDPKSIDQLVLNFPATPIILLVNRSDAREAFAALNTGVSDFLIKDGNGEFLKAIDPASRKTLAIFHDREASRRKNEKLQHELDTTLRNLEKETTSHKHTLLELLRSNEIYRNLVETSSDRTWEMDINMHYTFSSSQVIDMLGYSPEETIGRSPLDFMTIDNAARAKNSFAAFYKSQQPFYLQENTFRHRDGSEMVLESNAVPLFKSSGEFKGFRGVDRNITNRKMAREKLRRALKMQKTANDLMKISLEPAVFKEQLQNALDLILSCSFEGLQKKGAIFTVEDEPGMLNLQVHKGFSEEQTVICHKIPFGTCICGRAAENRKIGGFRCESEIHDIKIKGAEPHSHCCIPIVRGEEVLGIINLYLDIDHNWGSEEEEFMKSLGQSMASIIVRHRTDEKNRKLQAQVAYRKKMETISRMAGGIAHDFNNVLTAISGYSQLILMDCKKGTTLHENAEIINESSRRAAELVRQLLTFSQEQRTIPSKISFNDILDKLADAIRSIAGENVTTTFTRAENLWDINIDYAQMDQLIMNLVKNARDALEKNGGNLQIETRNISLGHQFARSHHGVKPGDYVLVSFKDDGPGISPEVREKIFEPFFSTKSEKGHGLGLATVYGIVKQNNGNIFVTSEPGKGATFEVYLPRAVEEGEKSTISVDPEMEGGKETILVVDDEKEIRNYVERVLGGLGYNLLIAEDGVSALEYYENYGDTVDLLLTDVYMPRMDGIELAARLRNRQEDIRVLYMSGFADNPEVHRDIITRGANYMSKPISPQRLASAVRMILDMPTDKAGHA
ncbi:MAG: response regulator [Proteobacteria bacterium]|nr:response regulator [Pseudomonadota bacterium]MBU1739350.1 response regulator [Pseudomonadota bacterium]